MHETQYPKAPKMVIEIIRGRVAILNSAIETDRHTYERYLRNITEQKELDNYLVAHSNAENGR